jgi:predicted RNA-binding protein associated with RNAse of E/G family
MPSTTVKKLRIDRIPMKETTIIDFDGIAFALDEGQVIEALADLSKSLNGIRVNRQIPDKK